jgi:hypothetical protein
MIASTALLLSALSMAVTEESVHGYNLDPSTESCTARVERSTELLRRHPLLSDARPSLSCESSGPNYNAFIDLETIPQNVEIVARVLHAEGATVYLTYDWVPGHTPNGEDTWKLMKRVIGATSGAYATLSACHDDIYIQSRAMLLEMESAPFAVDCIYAEDDSVAMTLGFASGSRDDSWLPAKKGPFWQVSYWA